MPSYLPGRLGWDRARRIGRQLVPILVVAVGIAHLAYYFPRVVDDLFISLRYARNLARGRGAVYNVGEHVEGYSSPLWMLAQAIGVVLHAEPVTWTKALGLVSFVGLLVVLQRVARTQLGAGPTVAWIAPALVVANSYVVNWTMLGLETPAHLLLLVATGWSSERFVRAPRTERGAFHRAFACAFVSVVAFGAVRPEAPLHLAAIALGVIAGARSWPETRTRFLRISTVVAPASVVLAALLVARHHYYGHWVPHTFFVKGTGSGSAFDLRKLSPLIDEGAPLSERLFLTLGAIGLVVAAVRRRIVWPLSALLSGALVGVSVDRDWLPSLRHVLPIYVLVTLGSVALIAETVAYLRSRRPARLLAVGLTALSVEIVSLAAVQLAAIDNRYSVDEHSDARGWIRFKTMPLVDDAVLALRHREPPHVRAMNGFEMGALTQNFRVLEASSGPLDESWYVGRDIGVVGFYTGVRVFDTAGLFTPDVVADVGWRRHRSVSRALLERMLDHRPVAMELLDHWSHAIAVEPDLLHGYTIVGWQNDDPIELVAKTNAHPSVAEIRARYQGSAAEFPHWFFLETLYGESVGAAMEKRLRFVESATSDRPDDAHIPLSGDGITIADAVLTRGCSVSPADARAGDEVELACAFDVLKRPERDYTIFVHVEGPAHSRFAADHFPSLGARSTSTWLPGTHVRDVTRIAIPPDAKPGAYRIFFGLWHPDVPTTSTPANKLDAAKRPIGPMLQVR